MDEWKDYIVEPGSILSEYVELDYPECTICFGEDEQGYALEMKYPYFYWALKEDVESGDIKNDIFEDNLCLEFMPERGYYPQDLLPKGETFRLPDFAYLYRQQSILVSQRLFQALQLSKKLGASHGEAILHDPFGGVHRNYHYISFFNPLFLPRAEKRMSGVPPAQRPFIYIRETQYNHKIMVHKASYESWQQAGYTGLNMDTKRVARKNEGDVRYLCYLSLDDWQQNKYEAHYY